MSNETVAGFRLSVQQERTWSHHAAGISPFWAECDVALTGELDAGKLQKIIRDLVARHEILRTVFHRQPALTVPFQVILETADFAWISAELEGLDEQARREEARKLVSTRDSQCDLERGPLLHVVMVRVAPQQHRVVLSVPALCADRATMQNLVSEMFLTYALRSAPDDDVLQYADVAEWQRELQTGDESKAGRDYWRDYYRKIDLTALASTLAPFEKKSTGDFVPDVVVVSAELQSLGRQARALPREFLLACWQVFLSRMTGAQQIVCGYQVEGRTLPELSGALGAFANFLPLQSDCSTEIAFQDVLDQVQRDSLGFCNWQASFSWASSVCRVSSRSQCSHWPLSILSFPTRRLSET